MNDYKCIFSLRVARKLVAEGYDLVDIQPSQKARGQLVFVFRNAEAVNEFLTKQKTEKR